VTVALVALGLDQGSKYLVVENLPPREAVPVLGEVLQFFLVRNPGAAFSLASGYTWIFSIAAAAVTVVIVVFARRIRSLSWAVLFGMLLGGTLGNLIDRLFREPGFGVGHVIDFVQVIYFPAIFNVADSFIVASMGLFVLLTLRGTGLDGTRESRTADDAGPGADADADATGTGATGAAADGTATGGVAATGTAASDAVPSRPAPGDGAP